MSPRAADARSEHKSAQMPSNKSARVDNGLEAWEARLKAEADAFVRNRQPDPLDQFLR